MTTGSINLVIGDRGSGKTCFVTTELFMHYMAGFNVYCNYKLFNIPYYNLNKLSSFNEIKTRNNVFGLDELYMDSDCRTSGSLSSRFISEKIMQSRKFGGGGKNIIYIANPFADLNDKRIRGLANYIYEPEVLREDENGKPLLLKMEYFKIGENRKKIKSFILPTQFNGFDIPELYDTYEEIESMDNDLQYNDNMRLIKKYWDSPINKKSSLAAVMKIEEMKEGIMVSPSVASTVADYIITMRDKET